MKRLALPALALLVLASCQDANPPVAPDAPDARSAVNQALEPYVVVFQDDVANVPELANRMTRTYGQRPSFVYETALKGFAASLPAAAAQALEAHPLVAYVEPDMVRTISAQEVPTGIDRIFATGNASLGIDGADDERVDVDVAIIDTGIDFEHPDLDVVGGISCVGGGPFGGGCEVGGDDDHYHGTHVGGTVAALDNGIGVVGVAPGARLWAVKVLDRRGSGYTSWIVAGIDWVAANAETIEVANMSLGGSGFNQAEYDAIQGAVDAGVAFAVAAGNSGADANNYSPAAFDNVLTVSALADFDGAPGGLAAYTCRSDEDDTLANFSNWGTAVDIAAPGVCTLSTFPLESGAYGTISGTSMASPHAAGALALLASGNNPDNAGDVAALYNQVVNAGNFNWTDDSGDAILEPLLDVSSFGATMVATGGGGGGDPTDTTDPSVAITAPSNGATVSGDVTVEANASDAGSGVDQVEFFVDGASIGTDADGSDGWSAVWTTTNDADGGHEITAVATDGAGNSATSAAVSVTVDNGGSGGGGEVGSFSLTATGEKFRGDKQVSLSWTGSSATSFAVFRDGEHVATVNATAYGESLGKGGGTYVYQVCEAGTAVCSNTAEVIF